MIDELYDIDELHPEFVEETEKPYDKYLKLHNYDPKTNTIEIDGKRVNAGARNISSKERNRMNKVLRENDYDPKTSTYKSDIKVKNPETGNVENKRVKMNFDTRKPTAAFGYMTRKGLDWDDSHINIQPADMRKKPKHAGSTLKHEEGHIHDYNDQDLSDENRSKEIRDLKDDIKEVNKKDFKDLKYSDRNAQMRHANDPQEKYADLYGELHNKQGFGGRKMGLARHKNEAKDMPEETKRLYTSALDKLEKSQARVADKDRIVDDLVRHDEQYNQLFSKKLDSLDRLSPFLKKLKMPPEERLENILGYSPKEIEELKKSGKFEDTLKAERLDDDFLESKRKKYSDESDGYANEMEAREAELLKNEDFQKKIAKEEEDINTQYDAEKRKIYDRLDAKKNFDAEMDSRSNYVERKIRELAEKDPEVKRKLAQYDEAIARRKQKLEKRKANKAEAREKEARRAQVQTEYYLDDIEITW
jgi:hypothetical protein